MAENPEGQLTRVTGLESTTRTDVFFTFSINAEGNNFIGSGKLDGNGIPADFFSDIHVRKAFAYCFNYEQYLHRRAAGRSCALEQRHAARHDRLPGRQPDLHLRPGQVRGRTSWPPPGPLKTATSLWDTGFRMTIGLQHRQHRPPDDRPDLPGRALGAERQLHRRSHRPALADLPGQPARQQPADLHQRLAGRHP